MFRRFMYQFSRMGDAQNADWIYNKEPSARIALVNLISSFSNGELKIIYKHDLTKYISIQLDNAVIYDDFRLEYGRSIDRNFAISHIPIIKSPIKLYFYKLSEVEIIVLITDLFDKYAPHYEYFANLYTKIGIKRKSPENENLPMHEDPYRMARMNFSNRLTFLWDEYITSRVSDNRDHGRRFISIIDNLIPINNIELLRRAWEDTLESYVSSRSPKSRISPSSDN
jgi:hypothetical protein